mgnify:CR=1 FL=1
MAVITSGKTFANGEQLTADKLNQVITAATFNSTDAVDNSTIILVGGAMAVRDAGITTAKIADSNVTKAKIENVANMKVLGNTSGSATSPQEVAILDEDNMSSDSATSLATQQSIKAYVDGTVSTSENGYMKLPNGVIMQWGTLTPSARLTDVTLPIAFPNACLNVQSSIGADFTDTNYDDNSLIWGGFPKSGDLSKITIMSNLALSNAAITYRKMFWQAIGN